MRGNALFTDFYDCPERTKRLIDWCVDWSLQIEQTIHEAASPREEWGRGVWGTWLPGRAVFVNGDPADLIDRRMQQEFDRPFTERLFTASGGGFFHHHSCGMHQVDQIPLTRGMLVHQISQDPKWPSPVALLLDDPPMRDKIVAASLRVPIMLEQIDLELLARLLPMLRPGRFILEVNCPDAAQAQEACRRVRAVNDP